MNICRLPLLRIALAVSAIVYLIPNVCAESPIDFSTSDNLKAVYDAGFRPWRNGMSSCHLDHVKAVVVLPENAQFSLPAEMVDFSVMQGDKLSHANFYGEVTPTDKAVEKVKEICQALKISTNGLDQAIPSFADRFSKPSRWGGKTQKGDISVQVMLDLLYFVDHIEAKVYVFLEWNQNSESMKFLTSPVQPPPGYEKESMAPPQTPNNPNPHQPYHTPEDYRSMIDKTMKGGSEVNLPAAPPTSYWILGGSIVAIFGGAGYYLFKRTGKNH